MSNELSIRAVDIFYGPRRDLGGSYGPPRWQFLRIATDAGVDGWSEAVLEGNPGAVRGALGELSEYLIGKDPRAIGHHWSRMYTDNFYRGGPVLVSAISAVDNALWDIKGKVLGVPTYELLGGPVRSAVPVYCHIGGTTGSELAEDALRAASQGFTVFKTVLSGPAPRLGEVRFVDSEVARFHQLREAIGPDYEFAIDFHGRASPALSRVLLAELESCRPLFVEEPCLPENVVAMKELRASTSIPIATGERLFTKWGFREAIEQRIADVYQPDVCHAGGISELVKIAAMADAHYATIAPHNPLGPVALAASLQVDCVCENALIQELVRDLGEGLIEEPFRVVDGMIAAPAGPGLGVTVNLDALRPASAEDDWTWPIPPLSYRDGSVAPW
jgi:galactonate dehydratase